MKKSTVLMAVQDTVDDALYEVQDAEDPQDIVMELTDELFGNLVKRKLIDDYDVEDMIETLDPVSTILQAAEDRSCVADGDPGLWDGLEPYGVPASVAFFSLEHLIMKELRKRGVDI